MNAETRTNTPVENREAFEARLRRFTLLQREKIMWAHDFSEHAHQNSPRRASGEEFFVHPRAAAIILLDEAGVTDAPLVETTLLHDVPEETRVLGDQIDVVNSVWEKRVRMRLTWAFGKRVADMTVSLSKPIVEHREIKTEEEANKRYLDGLREPGTILVKMADRLHNLRTLTHLPVERQIEILRETHEDYLPIFERGLTGKYARETAILLNKIKEAIAVNNLRLGLQSPQEDSTQASS